MAEVKFVAEVSSNHARDLERGKAFIRAAREVGCHGVKFQLFKVDQLFAPEILAKSAVHRKRQEWELPVEFIPELADCAHSLGIEFACTPFYLAAVDELEPFVDFYKIASYELLWHDLFRKAASTGKPLVFSTGMATFEEIEAAIKVLAGQATRDVTVLHCTSAYPAPIAEANLKEIDTLREKLSPYMRELNLSYGYSDHTVSPAVILRAVNRYRATLVEFHLDLDGKGEEYEAGHCWLPDEIAPVIRWVREGFQADGSGDIEPSESELSDREWRADPGDGLRPLVHVRREWSG